MRRFYLFLALTSILMSAACALQAAPVDYVRPQIDTHKSRWFYFSSACRPFGMVSLSPDTQIKGSWKSGYIYDSTQVRCFSHIHCWQISGIPVMPTTGAVQGHLGMEACKSPFSHEKEVVKPGYHQLYLERYGIDVELTSTDRVGMHRYRYPKGEKANVLFDVGAFLGHGKMESAAIRKVSEREIAGYSVMAPTFRRSKSLKVWFVARFDRVKKDSFADWNRELGKIQVEGGSEAERIKFYTDLWHSLLGRHIFSDVNGKYIDNTGQEPVVRQVPLKDGRPVRNTYNSDAFWGSEFTLNILWSIAYPRIMSEFVSTLTDYYNNGGMIARGPSGGNYTFVMVGDQATPLIAAAYNKGIRDYAGYGRKANDLMRHYIDRGYVPEGIPGNGMHRGGCALTLYFAYEDWCMGQFALGMGKKELFEKYDRRSGSYHYVFDHVTGWMRPRNADGTWLENFDPVGEGFTMPGFVESNSAIFTYYVPHGIPDLIALQGGKEIFVERLNRQFEDAAAKRFISTAGL